MIFSKKLLKLNNIKHGFFNRLGGSSKGVYQSLNCGRGSKDNKKNIAKNINYACGKLNSSFKRLILLNQIHRNKFHIVTSENDFKKKLMADALITKEKNIILGILTADCAPVFIYDKKLKIISAVHAGWKGAYKGIINRVIKYLYKTGSKPENLVAVVGPCITQKNYEIKKDFKQKFLKQSDKNKIFFKDLGNKTYFSLNKYIYNQLLKLRINNIEIIKKDTYDKKNNFFSARRSNHNKHNDYGRNISLIMIN